MQQHVQKVQANAGHQDGCHGHQSNRVGRVTNSLQAGLDDRTLILTKQFLHPLERNRVHVPGVACNVGHLLNRAVLRGMKAVVHAGSQPQRDVGAIAERFHSGRVAQQLLQRVREAFGLDDLCALDDAVGTDDTVTGAGQQAHVLGDRPLSGFQFPGEAIVQAGEVRFFGLAQVQIRKKTPDRNRRVPHEGIFQPAEPAHEACCSPAGQTVGQQKVQVFVAKNVVDNRSDRHG